MNEIQSIRLSPSLSIEWFELQIDDHLNTKMHLFWIENISCVYLCRIASIELHIYIYVMVCCCLSIEQFRKWYPDKIWLCLWHKTLNNKINHRVSHSRKRMTHEWKPGGTLHEGSYHILCRIFFFASCHFGDCQVFDPTYFIFIIYSGIKFYKIFTQNALMK